VRCVEAGRIGGREPRLQNKEEGGEALALSKVMSGEHSRAEYHSRDKHRELVA